MVGAAILHQDTCLVVQRSADMSTPLKWEFPGGKVEPGESPRQALVREIYEELALDVAIDSWIGRGSAGRPGSRSVVLDVFLAAPRGGDLLLQEHHRHGWFHAAELDSLDWADPDVPVLPALKRILSERGSA